MTSFADLGVAPPLVATLTRLGVTEPFPIQTLALPDALAGRDVCGKASTGSGKTLAFGIPLVQRIEPGAPGPQALVLVPTRELALQVYEVIRPLAETAGLAISAVYGGANLDRQVSQARDGIDIIVATPGRLIDLLQREALKLDRVKIAVVDEADRMTDLGFMPQVDWILRRLGAHRPQMMLFSATLDGQVNSLVRTNMVDPVRHSLTADDNDVPEIAHRFLAVHEMDRVRVAAAILRNAHRSIVFVRTKRSADRLAEQLRKEGVSVDPMHGDLRQTAREKALAAFGAGRVQALVATDVAARGIHVEDVDVVLHFDPPEDHKAYLHRSGRTARAGRTGTAVTFVLWNQELEINRLQKRLGLAEPIVEVFSNDPRLADVAAFAHAAEAVETVAS